MLPPGHLSHFCSLIMDNYGTQFTGLSWKINELIYMQSTCSSPVNNNCSICIGYYYWYYYFYYMILPSLAGWRECGGHRFHNKEDIFGCVSILGDLVPRELHFYSQEENVIFSAPAHTRLYISLSCRFPSISFSSHSSLLTDFQRGHSPHLS